ncbi:DUF930 domain-containing protein [Agrobacterium tumefaciens]|uniref:DUF930 domain-containing protein n=1 Tax=Agrobacterium tumefaciens TaxID=358 RepID=UPI00287BFCAF|nr:DUF930 domain-containing protein [Agrobacterium tumefaciens]
MPASVLLHLLVVGAFFFQLPERMAEPQEPESISVDLVPPPEEQKAGEEKPEGQQQATEEQAKEEPQPPPPQPAAEETPQSPPLMPTLPSIAMRPEEAQNDPVDKPGKVEEPEKADAEPETPPKPATEEKTEEARNSDLASQSEDGEIAASLAPTEDAPPEKPPVPEPKPVEDKPADDAARQNAEKLPAAKSVLSSTMLSPAQRRHMFGELPPRRRIVQLCSSEAIAQVQNAGFALQGMVPFSDKGGLISDNRLDATGGAFNVGSQWHDISFQCEVDVENYAVTAFRFKIGGAVTKADAAKRGLAALR